MRTLFLFILTIIVLFFTTCQSDPVIYQNKAITGDWDRNDTLKFDFNISDTVSTYDFYLNIRNTNEYPYSNIYFFINTKFPDDRQRRDTIECILANIRGKWLGKGNGNMKENTILIRKNFAFPAFGTYNIEIEQAMRVQKLKGIKDIGIRLTKNKNNHSN